MAMHKTKYIRDIDKVEQLSKKERKALKAVEEKYSFRANDYYLSLIDWDDPEDPLRKIVIPDLSELDNFGDLDPSDEESNYVVPGLQHKYTYTALLLVNEVCGGYCRFCFRKRLFMNESDEIINDIDPGLEYIKNNDQINNVLITGGDPLLMSTKKLERIIRPIRKIEHVNIIRIGTKMPAYNPYRIIDDPVLPNVLNRYSTRRKRIYIMTHFNHPRELTDASILALDMLIRAGTIVCNQTPILRGVNDDAATLRELMARLSSVGVTPYYFFQCRPTTGNMPFVLPLTEAYTVFEEAKRRVSGLSKRARLVMSHALGKIEIIGLTENHIYLKYHRARYPTDDSRFMIYHRDDNAYWLDDLTPVEEIPHPVADYGHRQAHVMGPE
jgi:lysine 2,3-aminomutase